MDRERIPRPLRGVRLFEAGAVEFRDHGWTVAGEHHGVHRVSLQRESCTCLDHTTRKIPCAHVFAALVARAKTRRCTGCGEPTLRRDLIEVTEDHESLTFFAGDHVCPQCAGDHGVTL
jgi:hypothetical protein